MVSFILLLLFMYIFVFWLHCIVASQEFSVFAVSRGYFSVAVLGLLSVWLFLL